MTATPSSPPAAPAAMEGTGETDSPAEQRGFEPLVPVKTDGLF
jgi:hypothetical protein